MSSIITGFTNDGFFRRSQLQIYDDYKVAASGVYEEFNLGPGSFPYQLSKIIGLREREMELLLESMVSGMCVDTAYGDFLEKLGIEKGVFQKGPQKAGGYIRLTFNAPGSSDAPVNLLGTYYATADGKVYYRSVIELSQYIRYYIGITRGVQSFDGLPSPYINIDGTGYVDSNIDGLGTSYDPIFNLETQTFNWDNATSYPATGAVYYVGISGYSISVKDDISASNEGTGYNVGTNSISKWFNNATLPTDTLINNPYDITGGSDWEDSEKLRTRIKLATNRSFTKDNIRTICEGINGVRASYVYQDSGIDKYSISGDYDVNKSNFPGGIRITGVYNEGNGEDVSGNIYGQHFSVGNGIMGLKKVSFYGRRIGIPPPLIVGLKIPSSDSYEMSGVFDTYDVSPPASTWQDLTTKIKYLDLDPTIEYSLDFWCATKSGATGSSYWNANYWEIATGDAQSGNLGVDDSYSGLLLIGGSAVDTGVNSVFRTYYPAAAITIDVAVKDGYSYGEIEEEIDSKLDWIDGEGYMPIGIDYSINQAIPIYIYYSVTTYLESNTDLDSTQDRIDVVVEEYVESLLPGKNVVYSQMYKNIINDTKIWRIDDLELWESGGIHSSGADVYIAEGEVAIFGGSTINKG